MNANITYNYNSMRNEDNISKNKKNCKKKFLINHHCIDKYIHCGQLQYNKMNVVFTIRTELVTH